MAVAELVHDLQAPPKTFMYHTIFILLEIPVLARICKNADFLRSSKMLILPAFGLFTGGKNIELSYDEVAYAIFPDGSDIIKIS